MVVQLLEYGLLIDSCSRVEELVVFLDSAAALKHVRLAGLPDRELKVSGPTYKTWSGKMIDGDSKTCARAILV